MIFDLLNDIDGMDVLSLIEKVIKDTGYGEMLDKDAEHDPQAKAARKTSANSCRWPKTTWTATLTAICRTSSKT